MLSSDIGTVSYGDDPGVVRKLHIIPDDVHIIKKVARLNAVLVTIDPGEISHRSLGSNGRSAIRSGADDPADIGITDVEIVDDCRIGNDVSVSFALVGII